MKKLTRFLPLLALASVVIAKQAQHQSPMTVDVPQNGNIVGITINQNDTTNNPNALTTNGNVTVKSLTCTGTPCGSGSGSGPSGSITAAAQFQVPYYSSSGSTTTIAGSSITVDGLGSFTVPYGISGGSLTIGGSPAVSLNPNGSWYGFGSTVPSGDSSSFNIGLGASALGSNTTGSENTCIGRLCLADSSTGGSNTAFGARTLQSLFSGDSNTAIGFTAGGNSMTTSGDKLTFVGAGTGVSTNSPLTNSSAIGEGAMISSSNTIQLGNHVNVLTDSISVISAAISNLSVTSTATITALSLVGTGNPSYIKNGDSTSYQIAGTSTTPTIGQCAAWTSSDTLQGITCGSASGAFINNSATHQSGTFNVDSGTVNGGFNVFSTSVPTNRWSTIENPLAWIDLQSSVGNYAGAQTSGLFVNVLDTGTHTNPLNDMVGIHSLARQFSTSDSQLVSIWADAYGQGPGSPNITGMYAVPAWASDLTGGTTSTMVGIIITPRVTSLDGSVNKSTGTVIGLEIPDYTSGTGSPGQNWAFYIPNPYPSYFNGTIGLGQTDPQAKLSIAVSTTAAYALIIGTNTIGSSATMGAGQYTLTVSSGGNVAAKGTYTGPTASLSQNLTVTNTQAVGSFPDPDAISLSGNSSGNTDCISSYIPGDYGSSAPFEQCRNGTSLKIGTKDLSGGMAPFITMTGTGSSYPVGSTITISVPVIAEQNLNTLQNVYLNGLQKYIALSNGQSDTSGLNVQATSVAGTNFARGLVANNIAWTGSAYTVGNNFGTDIAGMMYRANGDTAFMAANNLTNTTLTDSQLMALTHLYIVGSNGYTGVNMGATAPNSVQFQVLGSTTASYISFFSTATVGGNSIGISTNTEIKLNGSAGTNGQVLTSGGPGVVPSWTTVSGGSGGSGGYAVEPATVTYQLAKGVLISSGLVVSTQTAVITTTTTITSSMTVVLASAPASGFIRINLPSASANVGQDFMIYKVDAGSNPVIVQAVGSDLIESSGAVRLDAQSQHASLHSYGTGWGSGLGSIQYTPPYISNGITNEGNFQIGVSSRVMQCPIYVPVPVAVSGWRIDAQATGTNGKVSFGIFDRNGSNIIALSTQTIVSGVSNYLLPNPIQLAPGYYKEAITMNLTGSNLTGATPNDKSTLCSVGANPNHIDMSQVTLTTGNAQTGDKPHMELLVNGGLTTN